jgi:molybdopterin-guanine dinucleotide biosynthesis protein A
VTAPPRTTIVLMAGGLATRLPGKLSLPVNGEPMLVRIFKSLSASGRPCIVSARAPLDAALAASLPGPVVADELPDGGPLVGLVSAAAHVVTPLMFAAAGDLPNMDGAFVDALEAAYDAASASGVSAEAVVPTWPDGSVEPLAALYDSRAFLRCGRTALSTGKRNVTAAFEGMRVVPFAVRAEDEAKLANINTRADYEAHRK